MSDALIVSLDEFAELCGVTTETMRVHLRDVGKEGPVPAWLVERGDRGRAYKIEAEAGISWWRDRRAEEEAGTAARRERLQQLRFETVGEAVEQPDLLQLSGKQRRDEYAAAMEAIKYRRALNQLVERDAVVSALSIIAVEHRRRLAQVAPEFAIAAGLEPEQARALANLIERAVGQFVDAIEKLDVAAG